MTNTKTRLYDLLDTLEQKENEFYTKAIEMHEDARLRSLAKRIGSGNVQLIKTLSNYQQDELHYTKDGFTLRYYTYHGGDWDSSGWYTSKDTLFNVEDNKLFAKGKSGKGTLLELFPKITIDEIESKLEKEIIKSLGG